MRLDKYLSLASIGTRKMVKGYIYKGEIKVNGVINFEPAYIIDEKKDTVSYIGKKINGTQKAYYMFNKPKGCITARSDERSKTVMDYFSNIDTSGLFPIGRLDKDTEGLLIITNDGDLNHCLMHPDKDVKKTYYFRATGTINSAEIHHIENGIDIGYDAITKPANIEIFENTIGTEGYITISEGMKHQVKRMLRHIGCKVTYLKRISIGGLVLDADLKSGQYRELSENELQCIF